MLKKEDLININYIPDEEEISLELLFDFYENYLCRRVYKFTLDSGEEIKIVFKDSSEIYHISGIKHIYKVKYMDGSRFAKDVCYGNIDFKNLQKINPNAYKDYIERICSFACIDTILKKCEYLWFSEGRIEGTEISVKYLLLRTINECNLHLGIDSYKSGKSYYPKTLLVTKGAQINKFVNRATERFRVSKLEIILKEDGSVEELIDREEANKIVNDCIKDEIEQWLQKEFISILETYIFSEENLIRWEKYVNETINLDELKSIVNMLIVRNIMDEWISLFRNHLNS
ncbi:MAG: hypothetical protein IKL72_04855, partial [Firmicutes bacterium]|nr:hypothetical protein [Bacillota bacterium]